MRRLGDRPALTLVTLAISGVSVAVARAARARPRVGLLVAVGGAALVGLAVWTAVDGETVERQFSPESFEERRIGEWRLPFGDARLFRAWEQRRRSPVADVLVDRGWLLHRASEDARWDLLNHLCGWCHRGGGGARGFARELSSSVTVDWAAWTRANPECAAAVWPGVIGAARGGDYPRAAQLLREGHALHSHAGAGCPLAARR